MATLHDTPTLQMPGVHGVTSVPEEGTVKAGSGGKVVRTHAFDQV